MNRLRELRVQKGFTQARIAMEIGTSQQTISKIEKSISFFPIDLAINAANYFHVSLDYLFGLSDERYCRNATDELRIRSQKYTKLFDDIMSLSQEQITKVQAFVNEMKEV